MKTFKEFLSESKENDHIYFIHGGRDFDSIDPKFYGTGEPLNIRPLGKGLYGYHLDPTNPEQAHGAIHWTKRYATKYGGPDAKLHVFKLPKTAIGTWGSKNIGFTPRQSPNDNPQVKTTELPIGQTEMAILDHSIATRVGKYDLHTHHDDILKDFK